ncbi:unnamed protein product [Tetraodon nigroviridis]|uniref:Chromosome undetermined SCAF17132, whole genome shotgun sequence n=1 Tax=Tetraodon nigroviridis TaxID=99883 RepID=Q4RD85_TETNG|nr:unnamed protein product [Tetraodon nigroviridis]
MQLVSVEGDKASLAAHLDALKGELLHKCTELEEREHQFKQLQAEFAEAGHKHAKDLENVAVQVKQLEAQVLTKYVLLSHHVKKKKSVTVSLKHMLLP